MLRRFVHTNVCVVCVCVSKAYTHDTPKQLLVAAAKALHVNFVLSHG